VQKMQRAAAHPLPPQHPTEPEVNDPAYDITQISIYSAWRRPHESGSSPK
jgi:hypothetical protein